MPGGAFCSIIGCHSQSHDSKGNKQDHGLRFFCVPAVKKTGDEKMRALTERRRRAWIAAIRRRTITFSKTANHIRVCSRHFHKGCPAYEMMEVDPDWAPSLHLGHDEVKETNKGRHQRQQERSRRRATLGVGADVSKATTDNEGDAMDLGEGVQAQAETCCSKEVHTDLDCHYLQSIEQQLARLQDENRYLKETLAKKEMDLSSFENDNERVRYYTGLPSFARFMTLFNVIKAHLPQGARRALSPFHLLLITLMRLRLNLPNQHIAYLFSVHQSTVANCFMDTVSVLYERLHGVIYWPDRPSLQASMPHKFVESFGENVAVIIDCFEIFIERPSNVKAKAHQSQTSSHYEHNNTMKFLIGITPQGVISFLSKGWGGRASDKHVTENSGFLNNLLPGDKILAGRGFDIEESVGLMCAEVKIPAFTKGKCQMQAEDVEATRKIAHLRMHVERVIGNVVIKYQLLNDTIPSNLVLPCEGEEVTFLDKIVHVCCALTNMSPSVVSA